MRAPARGGGVSPKARKGSPAKLGSMKNPPSASARRRPSVSSEASFREMKKLMAAKAFLNMAGVKDRSKVVVVEDPEARAACLVAPRPAAATATCPRLRSPLGNRCWAGGGGGVRRRGGGAGGRRKKNNDSMLVSLEDAPHL